MGWGKMKLYKTQTLVFIYFCIINFYILIWWQKYNRVCQNTTQTGSNVSVTVLMIDWYQKIKCEISFRSLRKYNFELGSLALNKENFMFESV